MKKQKREEEVEVVAVEGANKNNANMEIARQTPANPPQSHDYIFRDGRRHVRPYYFEFISHVKNRWAGKTIVDLFAEEFKGRPRDYYVSAVKCGRIQVDGQVVPVSYVVKSSQKITHFLHRHEPPVMACDISVLHKDPEVVAVFKPATVPVHPCGQYRKNTVVGILQAEHDLAPLFPVHRLDRLVSGLLILARSASKADQFRQEIEGGMVQKQYVARVVGVYPEDEQVVDVSINHNAREGRSTAEGEDSPLKGKAACTKFTRITTNGVHSIVLCKPISGRTHQIRVHLQYMGHPIANDILYLSEHTPQQSAEKMGDNGVCHSLDNCLTPENMCSDSHKEIIKEDVEFDPMCTNCPNLVPKGYDVQEEGLWLHCVRYSGPEWTYECPYPYWASLT